MQKLVTFSFILLLFSVGSHAQTEKFVSDKNRCFVELGGNALYYSFNYHRTFIQKNRWAFGARVGVAPIELSTGVIPILAMADYGKGRLKLTMGLGISTWV